ncbi:MAG: hypothetical protein OEW37_11385, partial [Rhodospirillaceae bacterium]|nr:hypothetical protein [Rhodospirillaceae bacterium]
MHIIKPMVFEIKLKNSLLALSAFPAVIGVIGMVFLLHILPISGAGFFYNYDPAYTYLLNGLTMLDGNAPDHIDHPGTPLQILVAIVVFIRWLIAGINPDMVADAIENPEAYIASVSWVLLALNVGAAFYFGKKVYAATGSFVSAMICQSAPVLFLATAVRVVYLSPEALLLFFSMILLGMLAPIFFSSDAKNINTAKVSPVAVGLVSGFGIAAKITFLPMLPLLFLLGSRKKIFKS